MLNNPLSLTDSSGQSATCDTLNYDHCEESGGGYGAGEDLMFIHGQPGGGFGSGWNEFAVFDSVNGGNGTHAYSDQDWQNRMKDGYGSGISLNGHEVVCGVTICGYYDKYVAGMILPAISLVPQAAVPTNYVPSPADRIPTAEQRMMPVVKAVEHGKPLTQGDVVMLCTVGISLRNNGSSTTGSESTESKELSLRRNGHKMRGDLSISNL